MKVRRLVRFKSFRRATNPGAAGSPTVPSVHSWEVLQQFDSDTQTWIDIPLEYDEESREKAKDGMRDLYRRQR